MTVYSVESEACLRPTPPAYTVEANACSVLGNALEGVLTPWSDGTWWAEADGTRVGWIEVDGSLFPPLEYKILANL